MLEKKHIGAAVPNKACFLCAQLVKQEMIINNKPTEAAANKVRKLNGATIGFLDEPCDVCKEQMTRGIIVITINSKKTKNPKNPHRTGGFFLLTEQYIKQMLNGNEFKKWREDVLSRRFMFLEHNVAKKLGFFDLENSKDNEDGNKQ